MNIEDAIRQRVSVKDYEPHPVARDQIERLLDLAILAPNHRMTQPVSFRVLGPEAKRAYGEALAERKARKVDDPAAAEAVREKVIRRHTAVPAMLAVVVEVADDPEVREEDYATAFMAIQNVGLAAVEMGLGTHIKTGAVMNEPALREALEISDTQRLVAILFLGRPAEVPAPKPRDPAAERTLWLD